MGSDSTTFRGHPVLNAPEMVKENLQRGGYVVADGERVYFQKGCDRRRAVVIDLARTELIAEVSTRLVVNKAAMTMKHARIKPLLERLEAAVAARREPASA